MLRLADGRPVFQAQPGHLPVSYGSGAFVFGVEAIYAKP